MAMHIETGSMVSPQHYSSQALEHLGLVAGMYDELGLGELIDRVMVQDESSRIISLGQAIKGEKTGTDHLYPGLTWFSCVWMDIHENLIPLVPHHKLPTPTPTQSRTMTNTPTPESAVAPEAKPQQPWLELTALYPACFDWKQPRPLKIGIHNDLLAAGHDPKLVRRRRPTIRHQSMDTPEIRLMNLPLRRSFLRGRQ